MWEAQGDNEIERTVSNKGEADCGSHAKKRKKIATKPFGGIELTIGNEGEN